MQRDLKIRLIQFYKENSRFLINLMNCDMRKIFLSQTSKTSASVWSFSSKTN